jgi:hypothetical protein
MLNIQTTGITFEIVVIKRQRRSGVENPSTHVQTDGRYSSSEHLSATGRVQHTWKPINPVKGAITMAP